MSEEKDMKRTDGIAIALGAAIFVRGSCVNPHCSGKGQCLLSGPHGFSRLLEVARIDRDRRQA